MQIVIHEQNIAEAVADGVVVRSSSDALDLMARSDIPMPKKLILHRENIEPSFFDLKTGVAGEILQKFVTYQVQLAIVGDFSTIASESFQAFVRESNRGHHFFFVESIEAAKGKLSK
ncbi:MAG: hypothetical protein RL681_744 [Candidatus Parcubacteria bacterium]|jgi:hypothetical protein